MQKTKIKRIFVGCLAIGLLIGGYFVLQPVVGDWIKTAEGETTAPAKTPTVTVAKPLTMMIVEWDEYIGRMEAVESVDIRSRVSGYLEGYFFEEGDVVKAGDRLFQIDPRPFQAVLSEAKGALAEAESAVVEARALEAQSQAQREQVAAQVDLAAIRLKRNRRLIKQSAVSQDEYDAAKSALRQANADLAASEAVIASAKARTITAQATVRSATATLQTAELNLSFTNIHAPISGRIGRRLATNGNLIAGGTTGGADSSTLLTTIVSVSPIHCYFDANERDLLKYVRLDRSGERDSSRKVKNPVYLSLVDEDGFSHRGHMDFVDNRIDTRTGTIRGRAIFPNPDKVLAPGMFAELRLPGSGRYEATLIPDSAVGLDQSDQYLLVVGDDNKVERRTVKLGSMVHGLRIVVSGLEPDERIVTRGLQRARQGSEVVPEEETITATVGEGLPDEYTPIPEEKWLTPKPESDSIDTNIDSPQTSTGQDSAVPSPKETGGSTLRKPTSTTALRKPSVQTSSRGDAQ